MTGTTLAILYPGDRASRDRSAPAESRFEALFTAFAAAGVEVEPAVYHDDFCDEVEAQLRRLRGVLVWHNPVHDGRTRRVLDAMLRRVAASGVFVSAHPEAILRMGTKDVLVEVRDLPFGCDTHRVESLEQLREELPERLAAGPRVLKQHLGHSGSGVWRVEQLDRNNLLLRHAQRGSIDEQGPFALAVERLAPYFAGGRHMIDQVWQPRIADGMVRAYLVRDRVAGFGYQAVNALCSAVGGEPSPQPGPRLYSGPEDARFQGLRRLLEGEWVELLCRRVRIERDLLPLLWDADFLHGERQREDEERYVLCEINVSSVAPYPESANAGIVETARRTLALGQPRTARGRR